MQLEWVLNIQEQCKEHEIALFFKQCGGKNMNLTGRPVNGRIYDEMPELELQKSV